MVKLLGKKRRRTHAAVEHERLLSLVNSMGDGVIAVDQDLHVVLSNGAALNILDVNSSLHDKPIQSIFKPLDKNNQPVDIVKLIRDSKIPTTSRDLHLKYEDGSIVDLYVSIAPVHLGFGEHGLRGFVLLMRDITREKSLEEERDEFISVVSHELRTPLAITEGNISNAQFIVERNKDITSVKKALQEAHDQVLFLSSMVNDLATLSRAERGKLTVEIESIDVPALLQQLADNYASDVKKRHLRFIVNVDQGVTTLQSSNLYVREILQNFLTNALKYTEKGTITLSVSSKEKGLLFTVHDTGIGISKRDQEKLFDKFFRSEDYRTRKTSGTGLGLYVTMKLARLLHADIDVKSRLNEGSTFSIFIPNLG